MNEPPRWRGCPLRNSFRASEVTHFVRRLTRVFLVVDSTCLICFEQLGLSARLTAAGARLGIVDAVRQEVGLDLDGKAVHGLAGSTVMSRVKADSAVLDERREAIAVCRDDPRWRVFVSDDYQAQRVAEAYGVQTLDTRGLLWTLCVAGRISYAEFCDGVRKARGK